MKSVIVNAEYDKVARHVYRYVDMSIRTRDAYRLLEIRKQVIRDNSCVDDEIIFSYLFRRVVRRYINKLYSITKSQKYIYVSVHAYL